MHVICRFGNEREKEQSCPPNRTITARKDSQVRNSKLHWDIERCLPKANQGIKKE